MFNVLLISVFFFKQKTAYEMRISDWSSDVCSSDLQPHPSVADRLALVRSRGRGGHEGLPAPLIVRQHLIDLVPEPVEVDAMRSAECRVGKECVSTCRSRWSQYH